MVVVTVLIMVEGEKEKMERVMVMEIGFHGQFKEPPNVETWELLNVYHSLV